MALAAVGGLVVAVAVTAALSWHFSSRVLVPDHEPWSEDVDIVAVEPDRVVLVRSETALRPGFYGLAWDRGHAVVGPVLRDDVDTVTRQLDDVRGHLTPAADAGFDSDVYTGNPRRALGLPFRTVAVKGELGPMSAWLVPARWGRPPRGPADAPTWAIVVHGHNGDLQTGLRSVPALHRSGLPTLLISYRNDRGAPPSPDGHHHLGLTEWRDLEAAAEYALQHGAERLVLFGYSMGGAIVGQFMEHSPLAKHTAALILDAPALDWKEILAFNAEEMGLPALAALPLKWAIGARIDVDWEALDMASHPEDFHLPILLFHGGTDDLVPIKSSEEFAAALPGWTSFHRIPDAGHVRSWNVAPALYERRVRRFLDATLIPPHQNLALPMK